MATTYTVKLTQVKSLEPDEYVLTSTFTEASGVGKWDNHFFLIKVGSGDVTTDIYQHVCTVGDLEQYTTTRGAEGTFYRIDAWEQTFDTIEEMETEATLQQSRTEYLVDDWAAYAGTWPKTVMNTYTATSP